jgi:polysaccharide deacetylase family protein (PEP-CTERM system associated)
MSQAEFEEDITDSKKILEDITGEAVIGYRAPCFSISSDNGWAHDTILGAGYQYSSSSYPIQHDLYGVPNAPRTPYRLSNGLLEIPVSTWNFLNKQLPAGGGGYFRLLPYQLFKCSLRKSSEQLGVFNFYTHPWEFDPEQPKISASHKSQFRHYVNQSTALSKFAKLCHDFEFDTIANVHLGKNYPVLGKWTEVSRGNYEI